MDVVQRETAVGEAEAGAGATGAVWVMTLACLVTVVNYYDRTLLSTLAEPVRLDLGLNDAQFGILNGIAFALVYSLVAVPIALIADRLGRARILALSLGIWSVMTGLCAAATGFVSLCLFRLGVGLGEAGGLPATQALVADTISRRRRGHALSLLAVMSYVGMSMSGLAGAPVAERFGWRAAFLAGAVAGLVLCVALVATTWDMRRPAAPVATGSAPPIGRGVAILFGRPSFVWLCLGLGCIGIANLSIQAWGPAFFMREYGRSVGDVGVHFSLATAPAQIVATLLGGYLADVSRRRDARWPLWLIAGSFVVTLPLNLAFLNAGSFGLSMALLAPASFCGSLYIGPAYLLVQELSGPKLRATGAAIFLMIGNLLGLGFGPTITGFLSDRLAEDAGKAALGQALSIVTFSYLLGIVAFLLSSRTFRRDAARADADSAADPITPSNSVSN